MNTALKSFGGGPVDSLSNTIIDINSEKKINILKHSSN